MDTLHEDDFDTIHGFICVIHGTGTALWIDKSRGMLFWSLFADIENPASGINAVGADDTNDAEILPREIMLKQMTK